MIKITEGLMEVMENSMKRNGTNAIQASDLFEMTKFEALKNIVGQSVSETELKDMIKGIDCLYGTQLEKSNDRDILKRDKNKVLKEFMVETLEKLSNHSFNELVSDEQLLITALRSAEWKTVEKSSESGKLGYYVKFYENGDHQTSQLYASGLNEVKEILCKSIAKRIIGGKIIDEFMPGSPYADFASGEFYQVETVVPRTFNYE